MVKKKVVIIGATGSIGDSTLKIIEKHRESFEVIGIIANSNVKKLAKIAIDFDVKHVAILNENYYQDLRDLLKNRNTKIYAGNKGCLEVASLRSDITVSAAVGIQGLMPTICAIKNTKRLALANKESMICAGEIINKIACEYNTEIFPIDSEHNAIYQIIHNKNEYISKVILTASGGPFLNKTYEELKNVTPKEATTHPNWQMGKKVTVDTATLINKGLELIEAYQLFKFNSKQLDAIIHPQSFVHAIIDFEDGTSMMQMYKPHMTIPISYALGYPHRLTTDFSNLNLKEMGQLIFKEIDETKFPGFKLSKEVLNTEEQSHMIAFNVANEFAVSQFLDSKIKFLDIPKLIENILENAEIIKIEQLEDIIYYENHIITKCMELVNKIDYTSNIIN
ncbi:MAG: 1-deoxy-D-xylulose-5-phosphate reductoisomerase [Sphingobacteriia bacterium]|nr:1-deoxy-D-xylulose-5-phosphate reductoisomerase [Sphingobacteriia bacterium]